MCIVGNSTEWWLCFSGGTIHEHCNVRCPWGPHPWLRLWPQQYWYLFNSLFTIFMIWLKKSTSDQPFLMPCRILFLCTLVFFNTKTDLSFGLCFLLQLDVHPTCTFRLMTRSGWLGQALVIWLRWISLYPSTWWCHRCLHRATWVPLMVLLQVQHITDDQQFLMVGRTEWCTERKTCFGYFVYCECIIY